MRYLFTLLMLIACIIPSSAQRYHYSDPYEPGGYNNVITANVPHLLVIGSSFGIAGGVQYERYIGAGGKFSVSLPICAGFISNHSFSMSRIGVKYEDGTAWYVAPGIAYHPAGNAHRADFSVGAQLLAGNLSMKKYEYRDAVGGKKTTYDNTASLIAPLGVLNLNLYSESQFTFGIQVAAGPVIQSEATSGLIVQFGIRLGGCF